MAELEEGQGRAQISLPVPKFRNRKFSISPKLVLSGCGASRAWLGMRKRGLNTRSHASRTAPSPFMTAKYYGKHLRISKSPKSPNFKCAKYRNPQNLRISKPAKSQNFKMRKCHPPRSRHFTQRFSTLSTSHPHQLHATPRRPHAPAV